MSGPAARFVDLTGRAEPERELWPALVIPREAIEAEVERLAALPRPDTGRRHSSIVHPSAAGPGAGLAPGIRVTLEVLLPGERTAPLRHNSTAIQFCIRGSGRTVVAGRAIDFGRYDVWNLPCWSTYWHENPGPDPSVRLVYSNAALLEKLNVHEMEERPPEAVDAAAEPAAEPPPARTLPTFPLNEGGAWLMPYETLIDPEAVESRALHWPWPDVKRHLDRLSALGAGYVGRRLYLLYNPRTGRTNGTTPSFFATMTVRPPRIVDRPHRHTSAAINYYFSGSGRSQVAGATHEWKAGDLMLSAPGWAVHNHASHDEPVYELTVQDQPFHLALESLLWQEDLTRPLSVLGAQRGFATNRDEDGGR